MRRPFGPYGYPKPIVARFIFHSHLATKGKPYVNQQSTYTVTKMSIPHHEAIDAEGCQVKLGRDMLDIDGKIYIEHVDTATQIPVKRNQHSIAACHM